MGRFIYPEGKEQQTWPLTTTALFFLDIWVDLHMIYSLVYMYVSIFTWYSSNHSKRNFFNFKTE